VLLLEIPMSSARNTYGMHSSVMRMLGRFFPTLGFRWKILNDVNIVLRYARQNTTTSLRCFSNCS
jgi:hypothetical protein